MVHVPASPVSVKLPVEPVEVSIEAEMNPLRRKWTSAEKEKPFHVTCHLEAVEGIGIGPGGMLLRCEEKVLSLSTRCLSGVRSATGKKQLRQLPKIG
jgi:hypothetical protein